MPNAYNMRLLAIQKRAYEHGLASLTPEETHMLITQRIVRRGVDPAVEPVKRFSETQLSRPFLCLGGSWQKGEDEDEGPTYPKELHYP